MDLFEVITKRRTHRSEFSARPISESDLAQLIESARWAPSPFNVQPWHLVVVRDRVQKKSIADLTTRAIKEQFEDPQFLDDNGRWMRTSIEEWEQLQDGVLLQDHVDFPSDLSNPTVLRSLLKHASHLSLLGKLGLGGKPAQEIAGLVIQAPVLVMISMDRDQKPPGEAYLRWMWLGLGAMIQNILLTATALQIGSQFISAPIERTSDRQQLSQILGLPKSHEMVSLIRFGYLLHADGEGHLPAKGVRRHPSDFVSHEKYTQKKAE